MQIDLRTVSIKPIRQTFTHIADRIGPDKAASRYQEATLNVQADANFHYRPTWDPDHEIFDASRSKIVMADWYAFKDPRQFYYATYTTTRARMQETTEAGWPRPTPPTRSARRSMCWCRCAMSRGAPT